MSGNVMSNLMIDTIILTIPDADKIIYEPERFSPSLEGIRRKAEGNFGARLFTRHTLNIPAKKGYYPNLTVTPRWQRGKGLQVPLRIQFSAPKLIFGNNVDELTDDDFPRVVEILRQKLDLIGVRPYVHQLEEASVSAVHYSKNISLRNHYTASSAINILSKLDVTKKLEINKRHFQNKGHALYFDCGQYQIVFYDKMQDIVKNKRQAVDKEKTLDQLQLFKTLKEENRQLEILRLEVRITTKRKLNSLFRQNGYRIDPTLTDIFSQEKSQRFLQNYWNLIQEQGKFLLRISDDKPLNMVIKYQQNNGKKMPSLETLALAHILNYTQDNGLRELRNAFTSLYTDRTWYRFKKHLKTVESITDNQPKYQFVEDIESTLSSYKPFRTNKNPEEILKYN